MKGKSMKAMWYHKDYVIYVCIYYRLVDLKINK